ncbi:protein kinase domain-containing protein [Peptostreptococcus canis]|uniref:Protein kinase n=1 Tax=Peptostreptococcus canis TaxID=1159213 RepID=A0ABR6TKC1_9FIRM|nr:protein kinase [Peptostreptococcus canis]MBP1998036.1 serine/threonine protein kinase [Peptostreptococcus canis]
MIFIGNRYEITDRPVYIEENKLYNAYDSEKNINVKIKIIENNRYISLDFIPNLIDESLLINDLKCPYILGIVDVGVHRTVDNLLYYIVYENFNGVSLATLNKGAYLHLDALIRIATQTVKALQVYNSLGKNHGSLKPDDILVDDKYNIKIVDFGITEANRGTNIRCSGNLKYLSPSQLSIDFTDIKTDLYCLGLILYEATFKKFPFYEAHTEKQLMKAIDKGVIWSKINLNDQNREFIEIIKKLLERNDNLCYKNYNEIIMSLSHFMYKTQKIDTEAINSAIKPDLESVLDKTGRIDPEDFYKTNQIYLKDIHKALEEQERQKRMANLNTDSKKKNSKPKSKDLSIYKKAIVVLIVAMIVFGMIYSILI